MIYSWTWNTLKRWRAKLDQPSTDLDHMRTLCPTEKEIEMKMKYIGTLLAGIAIGYYLGQNYEFEVKTEKKDKTDG